MGIDDLRREQKAHLEYESVCASWLESLPQVMTAFAQLLSREGLQLRVYQMERYSTGTGLGSQKWEVPPDARGECAWAPAWAKRREQTKKESSSVEVVLSAIIGPMGHPSMGANDRVWWRNSHDNELVATALLKTFVRAVQKADSRSR